MGERRKTMTPADETANTTPEPVVQDPTQEELEQKMAELENLLARLKNEILTQQQRNQINAQIAALIGLIRLLFPGFPAYVPL